MRWCRYATVANVALLLAATVVVVASSGHRTATLLAAIFGTACFDVLHTRPYGSLSISRVDGLPGKEVELPVTSHGRLLGDLLLAPTPGEHVSSERRLVAVALADQVGSALCSQPLPGRFDADVSQQQRRQPHG